MVSIKVVLNFLALLTFAQFYNYFSLLRLHLFLLFIVVVIIGFVLGCFFAFRTNEYVMPNLEPRLIRPYREVKNDHLDDLVNYRVHQAIINYLNSPKSIATDHPSIESDPNDLFCSVKRQASFKAGNNSVTNRKNKIWTAGDNSSLNGEVEFDLGNSDNVSSGGGEDVDETGADLLSLDEENESQSNSKVDAYLEDLLELFVRDYIMSWLFWLIWDKDKFGALAKSEFRSVLTLLRKRLRRLDYVKIVSRDLIYRFNQHFMAVRRCSAQNEPFKLNYYEMDPEKEREHLRNITEIFLLNIFPEKSYFRNNAARFVIRELLVNLVFFPSLELVCDPDFINQRILFILGNRENVRNSLNNKFAHAATFEDFIKLIKSSNNVDELKQLHYKIMNEIMQATIISEFKSSSKLSNHDSILPSSSSAPVLKNGVITCGSSSFFASFSVSPDEANGDSDMAGINAGGYFLQSKSSSGGSSVSEKNSGAKSDTLRTRNNKIYIKQLRYAKLLCERRINRLNNPAGLNRTLSSTFYDEDANDLSFENKLKNRKIVPIDTILNSSKGRSNFLKYLEHDGSDRLLRFWIDVEKLSKINPRKKYELANKIYEIYLNTYDSPVRDEIGKDLNKSMQLFLMGNNTDEGFYKAQEKIKSVLEYDHYPSFIVTDLYEKALEEIDNEAKNTSITDKKMTNGSNANMLSVKIDSQNQFKSGTDPNKVQVENLVEKLSMKMSALNAFKSNGYQQCDSRLVEVLKNDIEKLKHDITIYESHIQKTELWCDNIGKWKTKVVGLRQPTLSNAALSNASLASINQVSPSSSAPASTLVETLPLFEIHVELHDDVENKPTGTMLSPRDPRFREGWVIYRTYRQFEILHESLMELMSPDIRLKFKRIPSSTLKRTSKSLDDEKSRQISKTVDEYLRMICTDESLSQSEALYTFLCPSPDYFKRSNSQNLQNAPDEKFSITSIFKSLRQKEINTAEGDEYLDRLFSESYLKSLDSTNAAKDSIAEPFYYLLEELFDIKGMKKLFRKSFILFVQLTYGATINRIIRERVYSFVLSDEYVSFYLKQLKDSFWSYDEKTNDYTLLPPNPIRSDEEKQKTKKHAKLKLLANIPETLSKLVGEKNSQIGVIKLFEMFQDKNINKHLAYSIIELFMTELFPEVPLDQINKQTPRPEI